MRGRVYTLAAALGLLAGCTEFDYPGDRALRQAESEVVSGDVHVVERGETLYQIAWQYGLDFRDVARWNNLRSADVIFAGQELVLKGTAGTRSEPGRSAAQSRGLGGPIAWQWPVEGQIVGAYDANAIGKRGIRIGAEPGSVVAAAAGGNVVYSGSGLRGYGNLVIIKHNDQFLTAYGYNSELLVGEGERVDGGDAIARVATRGERAGNLHFEIRQQGDPVNPASYLP